MGEGNERKRVRRLLEHTTELPESLRQDILSLGAGVVAPLVDMLSDEWLADRAAPGGGYGPVHAARLLAELKAPESIVPMVRRLMRSRPGDVLYEALFEVLESLGPQVVPAALEGLASTRNPDERFGLLGLLAQCGVRDERIYTALLEQLQEEDPMVGAINLADYGDPRALESLLKVLDAHEVDEDEEDLFANQTVIELEGAIEELGGRLDAAQRAKVERAQRSQQRVLETFFSLLDSLPTPRARRLPRPGRNAPCWCGSGVKYKKCHLRSDERLSEGPGSRRGPGPGVT